MRKELDAGTFIYFLNDFSRTSLNFLPLPGSIYVDLFARTIGHMLFTGYIESSWGKYVAKIGWADWLID